MIARRFRKDEPLIAFFQNKSSSFSFKSKFCILSMSRVSSSRSSSREVEVAVTTIDCSFLVLRSFAEPERFRSSRSKKLTWISGYAGSRFWNIGQRKFTQQSVFNELTFALQNLNFHRPLSIGHSGKNMTFFGGIREFFQSKWLKIRRLFESLKLNGVTSKSMIGSLLLAIKLWPSNLQPPKATASSEWTFSQKFQKLFHFLLNERHSSIPPTKIISSNILKF